MLLYWMIREFKPVNVIETGTHRGLTSLYMAQALYDNGVGHLTTADPFDEWGQVGNFRKFPELEKLITFRNIKGEDMLLDQENIDFAFIDGFHEEEVVTPEIETLLPRLNGRAIVVFHDCWYSNWGGVNEACEKAGLHTVWLPTKNALRLYSKHEQKPRE
jgi:predicted O-methyltransferase YrrM